MLIGYAPTKVVVMLKQTATKYTHFDFMIGTDDWQDAVVNPPLTIPTYWLMCSDLRKNPDINMEKLPCGSFREIFYGDYKDRRIEYVQNKEGIMLQITHKYGRARTKPISWDLFHNMLRNYSLVQEV